MPSIKTRKIQIGSDNSGGQWYYTFMRVLEFKQMTDAQLLQMADDCLAQMGPAPKGLRGINEYPALLLQAQLYMNEVDRRHSEKIEQRDLNFARRDFRMELIVIWLILLEVLIGVGGIVYGVREANEQAVILNQMNASAATTAMMMKDVKTASLEQAAKLKTLTEEEIKSIDSLKEMNSNLRASVKQTSNMTEAMQQQLQILKEDQAHRQAQLAKKPKLELNVGSVPVNTFFNITLKAREFTDTHATYDVSLKNSGDANATKGTLRVIIFAKEASLQSNAPVQRPYEEPDSPSHTFLMPFDYLRPTVTIPMSITFNYAKGQSPFTVVFNVDVEELPAATPLGSVIIRPPKPEK